MRLLEATGLSVPSHVVGKRAPLEGPVDLTLEAGEIVAITGRSGSGKTTLLRALARIDARALGEVKFRGALVANQAIPAFRRQVQYVPQQPPRFPTTVEDSFCRAFSFRSAPSPYDRERAGQLCAELDLPADIFEREVTELSVGEGQRVTLVRSLLLDPTVLLLDEPTSALDAQARETAQALIEEWVGAAERAAVLVSHDEAVRDRLSTRELALGGAP